MPSLREMAIIVLKESSEPMTYRQLTNAIWSTFPAHREHMIDLKETEQSAREIMRTRLGATVRDFPTDFTKSVSEGIILVGLAPTPEDEAEDERDDADATAPSVYWYTFPTHQRPDGPYPIKVGHAKKDPEVRIYQQITAMPEHAIILGTFQHPNARKLEQTLHAIFTLRGQHKTDAPGTEWFVTTPEEIEALIDIVLHA